MKNSTLILKAAVTLLFLGAFLTRCANIMSPDGGPKDTLPPVITAINPGNFATNFKEKKIYIEFNEYVQIKDQNKEMFTSAVPFATTTRATRSTLCAMYSLRAIL